MNSLDWCGLSLTTPYAGYIGQDSPHYGRRFVARIIANVEKLMDFPELGRRVPEAENRNDVRELIFQGYRIIYLTQADTVSIVTVIHGSRDLSNVEKQPWHMDQ